MTIVSKTTNQKAGLYAIALAVAAMPFSIKLCHAGLIAYLLTWTLEGNWHYKWHVLKTSLLLQFFVAFLLVMLVGLAYTEDFRSAKAILDKKIFFFLLPLALGTSAYRFDNKQCDAIFNLFLLSCGAGAIFCLLNAFMQTNGPAFYLSSTNFNLLHPDAPAAWLKLSYTALTDGIQIHPTYFSMYIAFCIAILVERLLTTKSRLSKLIAIPGLLFLSFILFMISSRIVILICLAVSCLFIWNFSRSHNLRSIVTLSIVVGCISIGAVVNPVTRYRTFEEVGQYDIRVSPNTEYATSVQIRASLWWLAWHTITPSTILAGVGTGDLTRSMRATSEKYGVSNILGSSDPHSEYLSIFVTHGVLGFIPFVALIAISFYLAWMSRDFILTFFLAIFFGTALTESVLELQKGIVFFSLFFPLLMFHRRQFSQFSIRKKFAYAG